MPITSGVGQSVNVYAGLTGSLPITSSIAEPVWVTGTVSTVVSIPPITTTEQSVGATGVLAPQSATLVGGSGSDGNLYPVSVDASGAILITGSFASSAPGSASGTYSIITDPLKGTKAYVGDDHDVKINDWGFPTIHVRFNSSFFDSGILEQDSAGAGTRVNDKSECILSAGDTASGSLSAISSHDVFVFAGGRLSNFNTIVRLDNTDATGVRRRWGYIDLDGTSGLYFELADGVMYAAQSYNGVETRTAIAGFPPTNGNYYKYEIHNTGFRVNYIISGIQVYTTSSITTTNHPNFDHTELPARFIVENTGTASAVCTLATQYFACHNPNVKGALIIDKEMNAASVTEVSALRVALPPYIKLNESFEAGSINGNRWSSSVVGGASATLAGTRAVLGTDGISGSAISYKSTQQFPGGADTHVREVNFQLSLGTGADANVLRQWGNYNGTSDGAFFRASGSLLQTVTVIGGVETVKIIDHGLISVFDDAEFYSYAIRRHGSHHIWFRVNNRIVDIRSSEAGPIISTDNDQPYFAIINNDTPTNHVEMSIMSVYLADEGGIVHRLAGNDGNGLVWEAGVTSLGALIVSSSMATPVWVTSTAPNSDLKLAADNAQYVTSSQALPIWVTSTDTNAGLKQAADLAQYVTSSEALPVWITGNIASPQTGRNDLDVITASGTGLGQSTVYLYGWNKTQWDRIESDPSDTDGVATQAGGLLDTDAHVRVFNGTSFDRLRGIGGAALVVISGTSLVSGSQPVFVTGVVAVSQTNPIGIVIVTSTQASPVWITSTTPNSDLKLAADNAQYVTSSQGLPVWVTSTDTNAGLKQAADLAQYVTSSQALPVWVTGILTTTGSTTIASITTPVTITSSFTSPVYVTSTAASPVITIGLHGVTGSVAISSGVITSITNNVHVDGLMGVTGTVTSNGLHGVTGTVAISSGVITSITNAVVVTSTSASPVWTTGTTTVTGALTASVALTGALPVTGLVGVSGAVTISSGTVTVQGLVGVTGAVAITSGVITSITNAVTVTSSVTSPVYVTSTLASPVNVVGLVGTTGTVAISSGVITAHADGLVGVTGAIAITSGVITAHADGLVGVSGAVAITSGVLTSITNTVVVTSTVANPSYVTSTITNPVNVTASQANPVTVATTGSWPITGTVTIAVTSALQVAWPANTGAISGTVTAEQTGAFVITGTTTVSQTGTWTVSQSNQPLTMSVEQTGAWTITGTVTQNIPAFASISGAITNAGDTVTLALNGAVGVALSLEGTFSGNIRPQVSYNNGADWHIIETVNPDYRIENLFTRVSSSGIFLPYYTAGATHVRLSATEMSSGQASVYISTNNSPPHVDMTAVENGEGIPKYGGMMGGNDAGVFRFVKVDQSGALYVSSSNDRPVWITGVITSVVSSTGTFVAVENSVGGDGGIAPVSATLVGGHNTGNLQSINVTPAGNQVVTGNMTVWNEGGFNVTSSITNPVWITGAIATTAGTQIVTSTLANPVWITGTSTVTGTVTATGTVNVNQTGAFVVTGSMTLGLTSSIPVTMGAITGTVTVAQTGAWVVTGTQTVTASQGSPVTVAVTATVPITGTVTIGLTSSLATNATGLVGVTGAVAITSGVLTSITNTVVVTSTLANPSYVTSTAANPISSIGLHGVTGTIAISSGVLTTLGAITNNVHTDGLHGVSGTVAITSGVLTSITNPVVVTSAFASPVYVSSTSGNPVNTVGLHGVSGTVAITSGVITTVGTITNNVHTDGLVGVSGTVAITSGVLTSITNTVVVTSTVASPSYVTSTIASPVNVTASSAAPVSVAIIGAIAATNAAAWATGVANPPTGTVAMGVTSVGNLATALQSTAEGFLAVSMTNPAGSGPVSGLVGVSGTVAITSGVLTTLGTITNPVTITSTFASPVYVSSTSGNPVNVAGLMGVSGTVAITSGVLTSITNAVVTVGLHGVSGTVAITSGVLTSITNPVVITATVASPAYVTSTITSPVNVTSSLANPVFIGGIVQATGASTPSDTFANPTVALLAMALNAVWDGTQWVRQRGGVSGTITQTKPAATSNVTQVSINGNSVVTVLNANTNRLGATIQNAGSSTFASHIKLGTVATLASYTVRIAQNGYYEVPANYNGAITAINSGSQATILHVTELTQ